MLKNSVVVAVTALLTGAALSNQPNKDPAEKRAALTRKSSVILATPDHQGDGGQKTPSATTNPPPPNTSLPDPNWLLVIIGALTCFVVGWQSYETRRSAESAARGVRIALKQAKIQAAGMKQWVDVVPNRLEPTPSWREFGVSLHFEATNNTDYLFTIQKVVTRMSYRAKEEEVFTVSAIVPLPPSKKSLSNTYPFYIGTRAISKEEIEDGVMVTINGEITFEDCLGHICTEWFGGIYTCKDQVFEYLRPAGFAPDHHKETRYENSN